MKNKKILIMIPLVLVVILALVLIFKENGQKVPESELELEAVTSYDEYFGINKLMNDYLNEDSNDTLDYTYYITELKTVKLKYNTYYLICGDKETYDYATSKMRMLENDCYLVNMYLKNDTYSIEKINSISDGYNNTKFLDNVVINGRASYEYSSTKVSKDYVIKYYINYYKDLLFVNANKAYKMLDSKYKNKFSGFDDFNNQREKIYDSLNINITDYSINGDDGKKTVKAVIYNGPIVTFKENGILNYTISIENNG